MEDNINSAKKNIKEAFVVIYETELLLNDLYNKKADEIKKQLKKLSSIRGSGTELISVYIPSTFVISDEIGKLKDEQSQCANIKSKTTRQNVIDALEKMIQYIKLYRNPPQNGMAVFCGNISPDQSRTDIQLFMITPPYPIKVNIYRCDSQFLLDPLLAMMEL